MDTARGGTPTGIAEGTEPTDKMWEVVDEDLTEMLLSTDGVLSMITRGRLGHYSRARREGDSAWSNTRERPEFAFAFPHFYFQSQGMDTDALGFAVVHPDLFQTLHFARELARNPESRKLGFWFTSYMDSIPAPIMRRTHMFQMWDGFYVAPIVDSSLVKPGGWLNIYLAAFNLTKKAQEHSLVMPDAFVTADAARHLNFSLRPWKWAAHKVAVPGNADPGRHTITLKTRSGADRAATAVAVGALTLGSYLYVPGAGGFSVSYETLPAWTAESITTWEAYALTAVSDQFTSRGADGIATARSGKFPKDAVLQRFATYLTPARVLGALQDMKRRPEESVVLLFSDFLLETFGFKSLEEAFPKA